MGRKAMRGTDRELPPVPHYLLHPLAARHWAVMGKARYLKGIGSSNRDRTREPGHDPDLQTSAR